MVGIFFGTFYRNILLTWDIDDPKIPYTTYLTNSSASLEIAQTEHWYGVSN